MRLFSIISRTLIGEVLPLCREAANWASNPWGYFWCLSQSVSFSNWYFNDMSMIGLIHVSLFLWLVQHECFFVCFFFFFFFVLHVKFDGYKLRIGYHLWTDFFNYFRYGSGSKLVDNLAHFFYHKNTSTPKFISATEHLSYNGYRDQSSNLRWAFYIALISLRKIWIQLFFLQQ